MRERWADLGAGHVWIHDGDTLSHRLALVDKYRLAGCNLFALGMGTPDIWAELAQNVYA